jgi:hypothetical protein
MNYYIPISILITLSMDQSYYPDGFSDLLLDAMPLPFDLIKLIQIYHGPFDKVRPNIRETLSDYDNLCIQSNFDTLFTICSLEKALVQTKWIQSMRDPLRSNTIQDFYPALEQGMLIRSLNTTSNLCAKMTVRILINYVKHITGSKKRCHRVLQLHRSYTTLLLQQKKFVEHVIEMPKKHILNHILQTVNTSKDLQDFIKEPQLLMNKKKCSKSWYLGKYIDHNKRKGPGLVQRVYSKFAKRPFEYERATKTYNTTPFEYEREPKIYNTTPLSHMRYYTRGLNYMSRVTPYFLNYSVLFKSVYSFSLIYSPLKNSYISKRTKFNKIRNWKRIGHRSTYRYDKRQGVRSGSSM